MRRGCSLPTLGAEGNSMAHLFCTFQYSATRTGVGLSSASSCPGRKTASCPPASPLLHLRSQPAELGRSDPATYHRERHIRALM